MRARGLLQISLSLKGRTELCWPHGLYCCLHLTWGYKCSQRRERRKTVYVTVLPDSECPFYLQRPLHACLRFWVLNSLSRSVASGPYTHIVRGHVCVGLHSIHRCVESVTRRSQQSLTCPLCDAMSEETQEHRARSLRSPQADDEAHESHSYTHTLGWEERLPATCTSVSVLCNTRQGTCLNLLLYL